MRSGSEIREVSASSVVVPRDGEVPAEFPASYRIAGIGSRFLATLLDSVFLVPVQIGVIISAVMIAPTGGSAKIAATLTGFALSLVLWCGYYILFESIWSGQTPGKRRMKIRVLKMSGGPVGFAATVTRNLVRIIEYLPFFYGLGVVIMFISPQCRRLGDYAAGTLVVKERTIEGYDAAVPIQPVASDTSRAPSRGEVDPDEMQWDLGSVTAEDLLIVKEFLERSRELPSRVSNTIGNQIAERLADRIGARHPLDPVQFLERLRYLHWTDGRSSR